LKNIDLDEESRKIIKEKLEEANNRIRNALEDRQKNLDSKLANPAGAKKK
jgi:TRAP-type C4-dicarboxylate transport system substrate-binding protein